MNNNKFNLWGIFLILCSCFLFSACTGGDNSSKDDYEVTTIANTVVAEITLTAQAAFTPTSEPTSTPYPTSTPSVDNELLQNLDYLTVEEEKMSECSSALNAMAASFIEVGDNVDLLFDQTFIDKLNGEIDDFETYCTNMGQVNPPAAMKAVNDYLLLADQEYQKSADYMRDGINNLDGDSLDSATNHLTIGTNYIDLATNELDSVLDSFQSE